MALSDKTNQFSSKDQIDDIIPDILTHFQPKINYLSYRTYGTNSSVAKSAFIELAKDTLKKALNSFLDKGYQDTKRNLSSYLGVSLNNLATSTFYDVNKVKRQGALICPICKVLEANERSILVSDNKMQRCDNCRAVIDRLEIELKNKTGEEAGLLQERIKSHQAFVFHSRKGYRCPECCRFIPVSLFQGNDVACPYPKCSFFGNMYEMTQMFHPATTIIQHNVSLDYKINYDSGQTLQEGLEDNHNCQSDSHLILEEQANKEFNVLSEVIDRQLERLRQKKENLVQWHSFVMYQAFQKMLDLFPEEMVNYLVHLKYSSDFPIQSRIFQEYLSCMKNILPFTVKINEQNIEILSLLDPHLDIFEGKSVFEAEVAENGIIPNRTVETYTGMRQYTKFGPCFIGLLLEVKRRDTGESVLNNVVGYGFTDIQVRGLEIGTPVIVEHFRIPSHYEIKSLTYLQKNRKQIVDKVYFQLHGVKRQPLRF